MYSGKSHYNIVKYQPPTNKNKWKKSKKKKKTVQFYDL